MLPLAAAWLDDREEDRDVPFPRGGAVWLESLRQTGATDKLRGDTCLRAVADHQQRLRGFETIFDHILSVRDERATGPVRFRRSPKAIRVSHDEVVFRLELERNRHFELTTGELPFPPKSQLVFSHSPKPSDAGGVRLRWQVSAKAETASPPSARLQSGGSSGTRAFVDVAFPRGIDEASIPTEGFFSADRPYPAERIMQAEVRRWTRADNRLNPVLNAVVNPSPTKPRAPAIRPRNPGIAKFRGQLAAVELGLAETPLVLIKGPPGTGKTTVIVELILQAAARGERVLVTSQTHQAVRNVLERLDRLGEVRIFRYGRDEKLSPLERKYARGGAAAADGRSTLIRARKRADAARRAYEQEAVDVIAYEAAVVAIEQLAGLAAERDNALAASEAQEQADREQAVACRERSDAQASAAAQATCDQIDRENALIESESQSAAAGLALLDARREILGGPPFGESPPVPLDFEAPLRLRRQRLRACLVAVRQHEHRLTAANRDHAALTAVLDTANQARQTQLAEAKSTLDKALAAADATLARAENEAANVRQQELDSAAADRKTAQAAAEKRLGTELARAERARNQLSLRELRTDRRMQTLDSQLDRFASGVRKLAGRNPRKTAPRQGILTRFFKHSSVEVLEGEWAHAAEARAALQTECVALAQARLEATAGAEKLRRQLEQAVAEIDAEYDQRNQSRTAAWERTLAAARTRHATETTRGHEAFQASKAVAERAYSEAVGDRPGQASRTATLRQLEAAQLHWWVAWRDALGQADGIEGSLETSVQHQLSGRELDSQDDDCSPTEASARLAELDQGTRILRGILITAEARLETNSERRRRATAECASQKARAAETLNARLAAIPTERARRDDSIHRRVALDRSRCLKQIGTAVGIARARGVNAAADDGPEAWQERIADREAVVGPLRETMEFTHRWVAELTKSVGVVEQLHWRHIDVFLATCVGVATWRRFNETGPDAVDLVIVDEAAHATLPEVLAPLRFGRRAILIGDEMQLPPINDVDTHSVQPKNDWLPADRLDDVPKSAAVAMSDNWMERSLFEWVFLRRRAVPRVMLDRQFRMHPDIGDFISSVFYAGKLRNGVDAADRHLSFGDFQAAVSVVSTSQYRERHERREQGGAGASYSNPAEAEIVLRILGQAVVGLTEAASFGVITPYAAQKRLLQHRIATDLPDRAHVRLDPDEDVGSVDSYQGSERDCIIVSMVRSPRSCPHCRGTGLQRGRRCRTCRGRGVAGAGLSFARDLRRLNVAFSRARCMLIVIGDFDRLCDTSVRGGEDGGKVLQQFSEHVLNRRGVVQHVWEADGHAG